MDLRDSCIVTLPLRTIDDRWVDVYVERRNADYYLVHDAGKTVTELLAHGLRMTDAKMTFLSGIADRFGVTIKDASFLVGCKIGGVHEAIMAVAQCASLGMVELLKHSPNFAQPPILSLVEHELDRWAADRALIQARVVVQGDSLQHTFDFVCSPHESKINTIAVSVLRPSYTPMSTAKLYGFTALDLGRSKYAMWKKLAILTKASEWTPDSLDLIEKLATKVIVVGSAESSQLHNDLPRVLDALADAA